MMSHRAPPELNGFGKTTWTPGLTRSSHVRMCLGLPLRRTKTTTDFETIPWYGFASHVLLTWPVWTSRSTSVDTEKLTTSAGRPAATALLCTSEAANDVVNLTPWPWGVSLYAAKSFGKTAVGIEYPTTLSVVSFREAEAAAGTSSASAIGMNNSFLIDLVVYQAQTTVKREGAPDGAPSKRSRSVSRSDGRRRVNRRLLFGRRRERRLDDANVRGLGALRALRCLELDLRAFGQGLEALAGDARVVHEEILRAVLRRDEAVALLVAEPLDGSGCHVCHLLAWMENKQGGGRLR